MSAKMKWLLLAWFVFLLPIIQLTKEAATYYLYIRQLRQLHSQVVPGMQKSQLIALLGPPNDTVNNSVGETFYWSAATKQGWLFNKLGLVTVKGHFGFAVRFNVEGKVISVTETSE
jgi:hypothetical protein